MIYGPAVIDCKRSWAALYSAICIMGLGMIMAPAVTNSVGKVAGTALGTIIVARRARTMLAIALLGSMLTLVFDVTLVVSCARLRSLSS